MSIYVRNILRFLVIIGLQVLLLNKIGLRWWGSPISGAPPFIPFLYPIFLLLLPVNTPKWSILLIGFFTGLTVDAFMDTGGMHAAACTVMAYLRTPVLSLMLPNKIEDFKQLTPSPGFMGWNAFLFYAATLLLLHHIIYFLVEVWSIRSIGYTLLKTLATLVTSILFVLIYTMLFDRRK